MTHHGWRKPTPGLVAAEKLAQAGERLSIPKSQAIVAVKKIATSIGLKAQDLLLLDTFAAFTQSQDWEQGRRPIVWASNNFLMEQTGFSLATLRRHIRHLCEAGIIWMKDSPNGKRWGRRGGHGHITEAYGFDLSPLAARTEEFEARYEQIQQNRRFCKSLRNTITITRRNIWAKIAKALEGRMKGPWCNLRGELDSLLAQLPKQTTQPGKLMDIVDWLKSLQEKVEAAFVAAFDQPVKADDKSSLQQADRDANVIPFYKNMTPTGAPDEAHIPITKEHYPVKSNSGEKIEPVNARLIGPPLVEAEKPKELDHDDGGGTQAPAQRSDIDVGTLMLTCPKFAETARDMVGYLRDWGDVHRVAGEIRPMMGMSVDIWDVAQRTLGHAIASAAVALIYDKYSNEEISSPGGYLRGMIEKARHGQLHLDRSFYGRLKERASL